MNFFLSDAQRIKRTAGEEKDLSRRLSRAIWTCRLFAVASAVLIVSAVIGGAAAILIGKDSGVWAVPLMVASGVASGVFYWLSRKDIDSIEFMKATLKEYRDYLEKVKGKA